MFMSLDSTKKLFILNDDTCIELLPYSIQKIVSILRSTYYIGLIVRSYNRIPINVDNYH